MVCDHTTYVLCTQIIDDCTDVSNLSVTNSVADLTLDKARAIGIMVIETSLEEKQVKNNCLIHYIFILPKLQSKDFGT